MLMVALFVLLCLLEVENHAIRKEELNSSLSEAVEQSVFTSMEQKTYKVTGEKEFLADVTQALTMGLKTNSKVIVKIMKADDKKGILSLRVQETYKNFLGKDSMVEETRTVIYNSDTSEDKKSYEIYFYLSKNDLLEKKNPYKAYVTQDGERIVTPTSPNMNQKKFAGWSDELDYEADLSQPIHENRSYYATWE